MPLPDQSPTVFVNVSTQQVTFRGVDPESDQDAARAAVRARLAVIEARLADYARETDRALEKFSAKKRMLQYILGALFKQPSTMYSRKAKRIARKDRKRMERLERQVENECKKLALQPRDSPADLNSRE